MTITGPGLNRAFALDNSTTNKTIAQLRHTTSYTLVVKASTIKGLGVPKPKVVLTRPPPGETLFPKISIKLEVIFTPGSLSTDTEIGI